MVGFAAAWGGTVTHRGVLLSLPRFLSYLTVANFTFIVNVNDVLVVMANLLAASSLNF